MEIFQSTEYTMFDARSTSWKVSFVDHDIMFINWFSQSSINRESAVDVDFEKSEEERWKRHSYAANEQSTDDVFTPPPRPKSTFFDSTILELSNVQQTPTNLNDSAGNSDKSSGSSPESEEVETVADIPSFVNRTSVDSQIGSFQPSSDSLNRRKSRSISNFQTEVQET